MIAPDFTSINDGISITPAVSAVIGAGFLIVATGFAVFIVKTLGRFFPSDPLQDKSSPEYAAKWKADIDRDIARLDEYRRTHPEWDPPRPRSATSSAGGGGQLRNDDPPTESWGVADAIASAPPSSPEPSPSSDSTSSDFSGGGGSFGGGGSSSDY